MDGLFKWRIVSQGASETSLDTPYGGAWSTPDRLKSHVSNTLDQ